ncbi:hypothetical protein VFPBJ_09195 [Purpureocillium lilacinum]|uniref:Uncharacterized protein n=1 Tax=Purpureocillium lilacinum TaxID=33203 RepID=A0A179GCH8_PURLI|nr:hypothetical protein VFPBJ_09195 [Purpureocillium lilacinum]
MAASETRLSPVRAATQPNPRSRFHRPPGAPASTADPTQREKKKPHRDRPCVEGWRGRETASGIAP